MKVLTLIIKQKWFDEILSGEMTIETREVRPNTMKKYTRIQDLNTGKIYDSYKDVPPEPENGEDKGIEFLPREYDAIQFWVGYQENRQGALVAIQKTEYVPYFYEEDQEPVTYEHDGIEFQAAVVEYTLGRIINKTNC